MKIKNIIISFFLLFVYSISFAYSLTFHTHSFVEHQNEISTVQENEHNHTHHSHSEHSKIKTAHITHNDHCDEGIFDLITCVLTDLTNHHHKDCNIEFQQNDETKRLNSQVNGKIISNFNTFTNHLVGFKLKLNQLNYQFNKNFLSPLIESQSQRGPPVLS